MNFATAFLIKGQYHLLPQAHESWLGSVAELSGLQFVRWVWWHYGEASPRSDHVSKAARDRYAQAARVVYISKILCIRPLFTDVDLLVMQQLEGSAKNVSLPLT